MTRRFIPLALLTVSALIAAGCGGGGSDSTSTQSTAKTSSASTATTVATRKTDLGTILVNSSGRTLYLFEKDKGDRSTCSGACAGAWPPLTTAAKPKGAGAVVAAKLGTSARGDGTSEVTYNGHPLYTYAGDAAPGDTTGEALNQFGAEWYALSPQGAKVAKGGG